MFNINKILIFLSCTSKICFKWVLKKKIRRSLFI